MTKISTILGCQIVKAVFKMYYLTSTYFFRIMFKNGLTKAVYHFIFDRLRSIRQDLIVQGNPDIAKSLQILQICVRFHLQVWSFLKQKDKICSSNNSFLKG